MLMQLAARSFAIEDLFSAPFQYVSPSFQRPFAWDGDDAERLLTDIQSALRSAPEEPYFLGAILLVRAAQAGLPQPEQPRPALVDTIFVGEERLFEIIDGQQRIVTLAILLAVLRDLVGADGRSPKSLVKRLAHTIKLADGHTPRVRLRGPDRDFLDHCICEAGACRVPPLHKADGPAQERLLQIRDTFVSELKALNTEDLARLAGFVLEKCAAVAIITTTIDRAYQMFTRLNDAGKPLSRNDILKAELIGKLPQEDQKRATEAWDALAHKLDKEFEHLFSYIREPNGRDGGKIIESVREQVAETPGGVRAFIFDILIPSGDILDVIQHAAHAGTPQSAEINRLLRYLGWLKGREWVPPLLEYWRIHGNDAGALLKFLQALDRFAYGVRLQGLGGSKRGQRMNELAAQIKSKAGTASSWPLIDFSRDDLRSMRFSLRDLHKRSAQVCRLVLFRLHEHFGGAPITDTSALTVEHILPQNAPANSRWRVEFPDGDARSKLATCLGNLTLIPKQINERAANHDFDRKHALYFSAEGQPISQLTLDLRPLKAWTAADIERREARFSEGIAILWRLV